jgi:hypothetical protein
MPEAPLRHCDMHGANGCTHASSGAHTAGADTATSNTGADPGADAFALSVDNMLGSGAGLQVRREQRAARGWVPTLSVRRRRL